MTTTIDGAVAMMGRLADAHIEDVLTTLEHDLATDDDDPWTADEITTAIADEHLHLLGWRRSAIANFRAWLVSA